jgi:hypothetical protein
MRCRAKRAKGFGRRLVIAAAVVLNSTYANSGGAEPASSHAPKAIRINEVRLSQALSPISLFGDSTQDLVLDVSNSVIGTVRTGHVIFLVNAARLGETPDQYRQNGYAAVNKEDRSGQWNAPDDTGFQWASHVGEFSYEEVHIFQKFNGDKFVATYVIHTVLEQGPHPTTLEDLTGAKLTINLFKLMDLGSHGTGYDHDFVLELLATVPASKVTGQPSDLEDEFVRLIRAN